MHNRATTYQSRYPDTFSEFMRLITHKPRPNACKPGKLRSLDCAPYHRSELQLGGGAPPCVSEGLLGLLIEAVEVKAAHTHMARRQVAKSSRERQWQDMRGRSAPLQHMQRAGMQSGGAQRAASHKCGGRERERRAQAKSRMACTKVGPIRPKFAQV